MSHPNDLSLEEPTCFAANVVETNSTFVLFKRGQEVARRSGLLPSAQFGQWIDNSVG